MTRYIRHVTLDTGASRDVEHDDIDAGALAMMRELVPEILRASAPMALPRMPGLWAHGRDGGWCITAQIYAGEDRPETPLLRLGVAGHQRCGAAVWRALHDDPRAVTSPEHMPPPPWSAALRLDGWADIARADPMAALMLEAFGPALAWGWLLEREARG